MTVRLEVVPLSDCALPPFTSKVTRTAFAVLTGRAPSFPKRRASFSLLFRRGKPLYRELKPREADPSRVKLLARRGEVLECRYSLLLSDTPALPEPSGVVEVGGAKFEARISGIEVVSFSEMSLDLPRKFVVRFLSPTLLPVPGRSKLLGRGGPRRRYRLVPDLPLALALLAYDLRVQGLVDISPDRMFKWAYRALAELDFKARPVSVLYTIKDGTPVVERGFVGRVAYEMLDDSSEYAERARLLLGYASRFGIGKSRSVGFGHVEIEPLHA